MLAAANSTMTTLISAILPKLTKRLDYLSELRRTFLVSTTGKPKNLCPVSEMAATAAITTATFNVACRNTIEIVPVEFLRIHRKK